MAAKCVNTNAKGEPCRMAPLEGSDRCFSHDPANARRRAEARRQGGKHRRKPRSGDAASVPAIRLRDVGSIQELLEEAVRDTVLQENSAQRSRTLGYLAGLALKTLEIGQLEERVAALEASLHSGNPQPRRVA